MLEDKSGKTLKDDIPSNYVDKFASVSRESWKHEDFRHKIVSIINEHMGTEQFTNKVWSIIKDFLRDESFTNKVKTISSIEVKSYIDKSRTKTIFWIIGLIITAVVALIAQKFLNIF